MTPWALGIGGYLLGGFLTAGALVCRTQYREGRGTKTENNFLDDCGDPDTPFPYMIGFMWPLFIATGAPIGICLLMSIGVRKFIPAFTPSHFLELGRKHKERDSLRLEKECEKQRLLEVYSKEIDQMLEERR